MPSFLHRAAGSRATVPAAIAESRVDYHTSDTIMRIAELPEHLIIVGGGFVAAEFAHIFSALGTRVTLVIRGATLLRRRRYITAHTAPSTPVAIAASRPCTRCASPNAMLSTSTPTSAPPR